MIKINTTILKPIECTFELSEEELDRRNGPPEPMTYGIGTTVRSSSRMTIIDLDYPLHRFYLKPRMWMWGAWRYGWKTDDDEQPDGMIGCYFTKELAMRAIEEREAREKETLRGLAIFCRLGGG